MKIRVGQIAGLIGIFAMAAAVLAETPPGPPWGNSSTPKAGERPASDAPTKDHFFTERLTNGSPLGVEVGIGAAIVKPTKDAEYELWYQIRVHTKKGELGALLGTTQRPNGAAFSLTSQVSKYDWLEMYGRVDINRQELSTMKNLPSREEGKLDDREVVLRVEGHLYDVAAKKWLSPEKTNAVILIAAVGKNSKVWSVMPLSQWILGRSTSEDGAKKIVAMLDDLDVYDQFDNKVDAALEDALYDKTGTDAAKVILISAVPVKTLGWKANFNLKKKLEEYAGGAAGALKTAAAKKLEEFKASSK